MMIEHQEAEILAGKLNPNPNMKIGLSAHIYSGLIADASVNCDDVEFIGQEIQKTFDNQDFVKCSFKETTK